MVEGSLSRCKDKKVQVRKDHENVPSVPLAELS